VSPPIDIGREEAARAAREELAKREYHVDDPGLVSRFLTWLRDWLQGLLDDASERSPDGLVGLAIIAGVLVLGLLVIRWRIGRLSRARARRDGAVFTGRRRTAAEHRAAADAAAAAGDYDTAVRERFRGIIRDLEERTVLDERPGRTADEVAHEVAALAPEVAEPIEFAARLFDEVCYGGRRATADTDARIRFADTAVRRVRAGALV